MPRPRSIIAATAHSATAGTKPCAGVRDQHAVGAGRGDVDGADVDGAAQEDGQLRQLAEQPLGPGRLPVADQGVAARARRPEARSGDSSRASALKRTSAIERNAAVARAPKYGASLSLG